MSMDLYFIDDEVGQVAQSADRIGAGCMGERQRRLSHTEIWRPLPVDQLARRPHPHLSLQFQRQRPDLAADAKLERQLESGDYEVIAINGVDEQSSAFFFIANKGRPAPGEAFFCEARWLRDAKPLAGLTATMRRAFADDGKHFVETYSATLTPPRMSVCAPGGACQKIWEGRSVADYDPIAPTPLEFKADDGTVLYGYLILPRKCGRKPEGPTDRAYLWRPCWTDRTGCLGRDQCALPPDSDE
jgi:hypothetical protein